MDMLNYQVPEGTKSFLATCWDTIVEFPRIPEVAYPSYD